MGDTAVDLSGPAVDNATDRGLANIEIAGEPFAHESRTTTGLRASGSAYALGMTTEPVELDSDLLARVRAVTGDVPGLIESAIRRQLDDRSFGRLLDELEAETGPLPEDLVAEAERFWHAS